MQQQQEFTVGQIMEAVKLWQGQAQIWGHPAAAFALCCLVYKVPLQFKGETSKHIGAFCPGG